MPVQTTQWDPAERLRSGDHITAYLDAVLHDDDLAVLSLALQHVARAPGIADAAREAIQKAIAAEDDLRLTVFLDVMAALGLRLRIEVA